MIEKSTLFLYNEPMKIGKGLFKGKTLISAPLPNLRPTLGRVKETFFGIIENYADFDDAVVCDFFSGTGNLGLESVSRGARTVYFIENNKDSLSLVKQNIALCKSETKSSIIFQDVFSAVDTLVRQAVHADIVILDPPFRQDYMNRLFAHPQFHLIIHPSGILACEVERNYTIQFDDSLWTLLKERQMAESMLYFLRRNDEKSNIPGDI